MDKPTEAGEKIRQDPTILAAQEYGILDCLKDITDLHTQDKLGQRREYGALSIIFPLSLSLMSSLWLSLPSFLSFFAHIFFFFSSPFYRYPREFLVFMSSIYSLLGASGYTKLRSLNFLPMPCRKTMELHILRDPQIEDGIEVSQHSLSLLEEV